MLAATTASKMKQNKLKKHILNDTLNSNKNVSIEFEKNSIKRKDY